MGNCTANFKKMAAKILLFRKGLALDDVYIVKRPLFGLIIEEKLSLRSLAESAAPDCRRMQKVFAEFFAGIGLMRAGLERAGWRAVFANDIDPVKARLYAANYPDARAHFALEDIWRLSGAAIPDVALATASFPCTDLSLAGRRAGLAGGQSSAFWGFERVLREMGDRCPPLALIENVPGLLSSNNGRDLESVLLALNALGYAVDVLVVDASHFVPQSRSRLFIVGRKMDGTDGARATPSLFSDADGLRPERLQAFIRRHAHIRWLHAPALPPLPARAVSLQDLIEPLPDDDQRWFDSKREAYLLGQLSPRHRARIEAQARRPTPAYFTAFRRVRNGRTVVEARFDDMAGCLRTPKGGSARQILLMAGGGRIRARHLTPLECARLMGAPDFVLSGSVTESLFGFGDAVCVPVVAWIAEHYLEALMPSLWPAPFPRPCPAPVF